MAGKAITVPPEVLAEAWRRATSNTDSFKIYLTPEERRTLAVRRLRAVVRRIQARQKP